MRKDAYQQKREGRGEEQTYGWTERGEKAGRKGHKNRENDERMQGVREGGKQEGRIKER